VPATISKLLSIIDRTNGAVIKRNPRCALFLSHHVCLQSLRYPSVLTKGTSAEVQISLRTNPLSGPSASPRPIPLEPFSISKDMGRVLIRRSGETISAGEATLVA
jgi:elongation factor 1 alpha-like protein